jgi:hypothetical protein
MESQGEENAVNEEARTGKNVLVERGGDLDLKNKEVIVYKHTCTVTNMSYVGQTTQGLMKRWKAQCLDGCGCKRLAAAIKEHGKKAWTHEILVDGLAEGEKANKVEDDMIILYDTLYPKGYNEYRGGGGTNTSNERQKTAQREAWKDPEKRANQLSWRTTEKISSMVNSLGQWKAQQRSWLQKRLETALSMPLEDALRMISYRTKKSIQQAKRQSRSDKRIQWMCKHKDKQIKKLCKAAGVPVPPASFYEQSTHAYECELAAKRGWAK